MLWSDETKIKLFAGGGLLPLTQPNMLWGGQDNCAAPKGGRMGPCTVKPWVRTSFPQPGHRKWVVGGRSSTTTIQSTRPRQQRMTHIKVTEGPSPSPGHDPRFELPNISYEAFLQRDQKLISFRAFFEMYFSALFVIVPSLTVQINLALKL